MERASNVALGFAIFSGQPEAILIFYGLSKYSAYKQGAIPVEMMRDEILISSRH